MTGLQQKETGAQAGAQCGLQKNSGAVVVVAIAAIRIAESMVNLHGGAILGWQRNQPSEMVRIGSLYVKRLRRNNQNRSCPRPKPPHFPFAFNHIEQFLAGYWHDYS